MATCNINSLLDSGKCFAAMPPFILDTDALQLWCDISNNIPTGVAGGIWNPEAGGPIYNPEAGGVIVNPEAT